MILLANRSKMHFLMCFFLLTVVYLPIFIHSLPVQDPELVVKEVQEALNASRRDPASPCKTGNPIDDCWRCDRDWEQHRQRLADCAIGFGKNATGGKDGKIYVVADPSDDPVNPKQGTLRYGAIQDEPLWIIFERDMVIQLKQELSIHSFKTIDGRGANVHIADGPCIAMTHVTNIIIHGINIHDCKGVLLPDGDGITIFNSSHVLVDHCSLSRCADGLIDVVQGSTAITLSNNHMTDHDKVMLLGADDSHTLDKNMQVTVAFNHFGEGLFQRMPRCRHGYFHVVNNDYTRWKAYAIGGSAAPTVNSQGNRFLASDDPYTKQVTRREGSEVEWKKWKWTSQGDEFLNGAYFVPSGNGSSSSYYTTAASLGAQPSSFVASMTTNAGALKCRKGRQC